MQYVLFWGMHQELEKLEGKCIWSPEAKNEDKLSDCMVDTKTKS